MSLARFFSGYTLAAAYAVLAVLMAIAVGTEVLLNTEPHPLTRFRALLVSTLLAGLAASVLIEHLGLHLLDN